MTLAIRQSSMMQKFVRRIAKDWRKVNLHRIVARGMACSSAASGDDEFTGLALTTWKEAKVNLKIFRRDKEFCHECRFCCTLSVCTDAMGTTFRDSGAELNKTAAQPRGSREVSAKMGYQVDMKLYKANDYRCLKPIAGRPSIEWPHYYMASFRAAKTESELQKAETIPFNVNYLNMEDPKVFKALTNPKSGADLMKKTYGFDFVALLGGMGGKANVNQCHQHCLRAEYGKFARQCKKSGGFFKCCILGSET